MSIFCLTTITDMNYRLQVISIEVDKFVDTVSLAL